MQKALVVDNDQLILEFLVDLLTEKGYEVQTADSGLKAIDILQTYRPDIIFIDLVMPNINGERLCRIIRRMTHVQEAFIVILSAIASELTDLNYKNFGADACIAKAPFEKMRNYILDTIALFESESGDALISKVIGLEDVFARGISKELIADNRHYELILSSISEGIIELNQNGRIVYANPSAVSLISIPPEGILGSYFRELFSERDLKRIDALLSDWVKTNAPAGLTSPVELRKHQVYLKIIPLPDMKNKGVVILHDVTQEKQREIQLIEAQKMEAIGTLAAGIAHDFNNLLMAIQGNTSLLLLDIDRNHRHYTRLKGIEKQVHSASQLTSQLLGYARKGRYEIRSVDLNSVVKDTSEAFRRTRKEITIQYDLSQDIPSIRVDQGQIEQALLNLFINAADAMPLGGELCISTRPVDASDLKGKPYVAKERPYIHLGIKDTGMGMDEKTIERIFDPFFTTKEMGRGTGLGLASAYGSIKGHGGYIDVESAPGLGSTFNIFLPVIDTTSDAAAVLPQKEVVPEKNRETILLVEDEEPIREVSHDMLLALGYQVIVASDGQEALEMYQIHGERIDLVLLDMIMPRMSGGKVYDRLKIMNPDVKVLLSSGYSIESQASDIIGKGCNAFIQKPFDIRTLNQALRKILDEDNCRP